MNRLKPFVLLTALFLLMAAGSRAATFRSLSIPSHKMKQMIPATLILPYAYERGEQRFPVLYLLHGAGGSHTGWRKQTNIAQLADQFRVIILCPDGGRTSWYFDSPIDPKFQYETFVAKECVAYLDANFRTKPERSQRAISGLSMGGHGALFLAIRHPDTFSMAVALSGGVDIRPFPEHWEIWKRLGKMETHPENWEQNTVINLAKQLKDGDLEIALDCGKNDFFLNVNRALHKQLTDAGIQHSYTEKPGAHTWEYWRAAIKRQMPSISEHFEKAAVQAPLIIDVRSAREFNGGHYDGALNIPYDELGQQIAQIESDKSRLFILYCASGNRAGKAQRELNQLGYKNVINGISLRQMQQDHPQPAASK